MNSNAQTPLLLWLLAGCCLALLLVNGWLHHQTLYQYWLHWYSQVGLVLYPLSVLAVVLAFNYAQLLIHANTDREKPLLLFAVVTYAAPTLGFIGTILGLQQGLTGFAAKTTPEALSQAVNGVVSGLTVSLSSTLLGGALGLLSGLSALIYRHINAPKPETGRANATSMAADTRQTEPPSAYTEPSQHNSQPEHLLRKLLNAAGFAHIPISRAVNANGQPVYALSLESPQQAKQLIPAIHQQKQLFGLGAMTLKRTDQHPNFLYLQL